jgi:hypothetical protein
MAAVIAPVASASAARRVGANSGRAGSRVALDVTGGLLGCAVSFRLVPPSPSPGRRPCRISASHWDGVSSGWRVIAAAAGYTRCSAEATRGRTISHTAGQCGLLLPACHQGVYARLRRAMEKVGMRGRFRESELVETPPHRAEFGFSPLPRGPLPAIPGSSPGRARNAGRDARMFGDRCQRRTAFHSFSPRAIRAFTPVFDGLWRRWDEGALPRV